MHIAIVTGGYYGLSGAFTNARELAVQLAARGHRVTVLAPDVHPTQGSEDLHFAHIRDIPLIPQGLFYLAALCGVHAQQPIEVIQAYTERI